MSAKETLESHAAELSAAIGKTVEVIEQGNQLFVMIRDYDLPAGVAKVSTADVLFIADAQYPLSAMDMFWTDLDVVRPDGSEFENSGSIEEYVGRKWRRFSYHRNGAWNPSGNPLEHHYAFMETRWTVRALK